MVRQIRSHIYSNYVYVYTHMYLHVYLVGMEGFSVGFHLVVGKKKSAGFPSLHIISSKKILVYTVCVQLYVYVCTVCMYIRVIVMLEQCIGTVRCVVGGNYHLEVCTGNGPNTCTCI